MKPYSRGQMVLLVIVILGVGIIGLYALLLTWQLRHGQVYIAWRQRMQAIRWAGYTSRWLLYRHHRIPDRGMRRFLRDPTQYRRMDDAWVLIPEDVPVPEGYTRPADVFVWAFSRPPFATPPPHVATVLWYRDRESQSLLETTFQPFPLGAFLLEIGPQTQGPLRVQLPPFGRIVFGRTFSENHLRLSARWQGEVWHVNDVRIPDTMAAGQVHPIPSFPAWTLWNDWTVWKRATQKRSVCGPEHAIGLYLGPEGTATYQAQIRRLFDVDGWYVFDLNEWDVCQGSGPVYRDVPLFPFDGSPGSPWPGWNGIVYIEGRFELRGTLRVPCMQHPGRAWHPGYLWIVHPGNDPGILVLPLQTVPPMVVPDAPVLIVLHHGATIVRWSGGRPHTLPWMGQYFLNGPIRWNIPWTNVQVHIVGGLYVNGKIESAGQVDISLRHPGMPPPAPPAACPADHWIWSVHTADITP